MPTALQSFQDSITALQFSGVIFGTDLVEVSFCAGFSLAAKTTTKSTPGAVIIEGCSLGLQMGETMDILIEPLDKQLPRRCFPIRSRSARILALPGEMESRPGCQRKNTPLLGAAPLPRWPLH